MRIMLGIVALAITGGGIVAWQLDDQTTAGILVRTGLVLGAVWLGWPSLVAVDRRRLWLALPIVAVVAFRPRSALVVIPVGIWFLLQQRSRSADE